MPSPYRRKTTKRKKMSSHDSILSVKSRKCDNENEIFSGKELIDKVLMNYKKMSEIIETIEHNPITQKEIELIVFKYSRQSFRTESLLGQKALIQRRIYEQAIGILGETV